MPRGQGTITLHAVQIHKQRLFLHKQFLNLNVKIRQHVNVRHVLGKHKGAVSRRTCRSSSTLAISASGSDSQASDLEDIFQAG